MMTGAGALVLTVLIICVTVYNIVKLHHLRDKEREERRNRSVDTDRQV